MGTKISLGEFPNSMFWPWILGFVFGFLVSKKCLLVWWLPWCESSWGQECLSICLSTYLPIIYLSIQLCMHLAQFLAHIGSSPNVFWVNNAKQNPWWFSFVIHFVYPLRLVICICQMRRKCEWPGLCTLYTLLFMTNHVHKFVMYFPIMFLFPHTFSPSYDSYCYNSYILIILKPQYSESLMDPGLQWNTSTWKWEPF